MRFYQGLDTIGGVILEIKCGNDRAFFEAGRTYNPSFDIFDGHVDKRKNFVSDYLWLNDIPRIDYIYRKEDIVNTELKSAEEAPPVPCFPSFSEKPEGGPAPAPERGS